MHESMRSLFSGGSSVQFHCFVDWATFQRDPDVNFFSSERSKSRKSILPWDWRTARKQSLSFVPCGSIWTERCVVICFETMNCFILCGQRETRRYLLLTQRWSNGLATLCSVIRKVLTLKMILCRLFCMSSTAAGNVGPGMEYWPKHV